MTGFPAHPDYTLAERRADAVVHILGIAMMVPGGLWLIGNAVGADPDVPKISLTVYALSLMGMVLASAIYNMAPQGRYKELLRRVDHAMIFVLIAGSQTPFVMTALGGPAGPLYCAVLWSVAVMGVALKLFWPHRLQRFSLALYLMMGWMVVLTIHPLTQAIPAGVLVLMLAGGVVYSLGTIFHVSKTLKFQNAIWHVFVLVAACIHFVAIALGFVA